MEIFAGWQDPSASVYQVRVLFGVGDCLLSPVVERRIGAPWSLGVVDEEEEVERPSYDVAAVAAARGVAGMPTVALDIEGSRTPAAFAPGLAHTYVHVDRGFVMTRLMLVNWIVEYGRLVVGTVFAACGQRPSDRALLVKLVSLSSFCELEISGSRKQKVCTCGGKMPRHRRAVGTWCVIYLWGRVTVGARDWLRV